MSIISKLNHKKTVDGRFEQLELLDALITERTIKSESLKARIAEIGYFYPGLEEDEAVTKYFADVKTESSKLDAEIAQKREELKQITEQLGILGEMDSIFKQRAKLQEEKRSFQEFRKNNVSLRDAVIAVYKIASYDRKYIDGFVYFSDTTYSVNGEPKTERLYRSIDGARIIGFTSDMKVHLISTNPNTELSINTVPVLWFPLVDVCDMLSVDLTSTVVSFDFIANVTTKFNNAFYFNENSKGKWYLERKKRN